MWQKNVSFVAMPHNNFPRKMAIQVRRQEIYWWYIAQASGDVFKAVSEDSMSN